MTNCTLCNVYTAFLPPSDHCSTCWTKYFDNNIGEVVAVNTFMHEHGEQPAVNKYGRRYLRQLNKYMKKRTNN